LQRLWNAGENGFKKRFLPRAKSATASGKDIPLPHFAARFGAKEALVKALGVGIRRGVHCGCRGAAGSFGQAGLESPWRASEICQREGIEGLFVSLTHDGDYSGADGST